MMMIKLYKSWFISADTWTEPTSNVQRVSDSVRDHVFLDTQLSLSEHVFICKQFSHHYNCPGL